MNAPKSSSSPALAVGIVGAGYIADYHVSALRAVPGVEVRAVCDLRASAAARFAEAQGIPASYGDLAEMLRSEKLDAVHVLTPPNAHVAPALALDLMEEFRPWADRLALTLINRGQLGADDFVLREGGGVLLEPDARKAVVVAYQERKKDEINHPLLAQSDRKSVV